MNPPFCPSSCPYLEDDICILAAGNWKDQPCLYEDPQWREKIKTMGSLKEPKSYPNNRRYKNASV